MEDRAAVDRLLKACQHQRLSDDRMQIKELEDLDLPQTVTHAFYFRYLLPIPSTAGRTAEAFRCLHTPWIRRVWYDDEGDTLGGHHRARRFHRQQS
jgi:hypothetical protein